MTSTTEILNSNAQLIKNRTNGITTTSSTAGNDAAAAKARLSGDLDFFLKMLTTQLKNQDPTQPMDVAQMTQQIAQYSGVEQQVQTNSNLEKLLKSNKQSELSTAVSYIGKEVEADGNTGQVIGGQGAFSYILPRQAASAQITIKNASGGIVFQGAGTTKAGRNLIVWDGVNSINGNREADGIYTLEVKANDASTNAITADVRAVGIVSGVENDADGNITLSIGTSQMKYSDILAVRSPTRAELPDDTGTGS